MTCEIIAVDEARSTSPLYFEEGQVFDESMRLVRWPEIGHTLIEVLVLKGVSCLRLLAQKAKNRVRQ